MKNKTSNVSVGMGGTLVITVFIVLCLMIFAVLSFMTAYWDLKLSNKAQAITEDYYIIHGKAEEKLSVINELLYKINLNEPKENIVEKLNNIDGVLVIDEKEMIIQYEETGIYNQKITVTLNLLQNESKYYYEIKSWSLSNIELPVYNDNIDIWEGI